MINIETTITEICKCVLFINYDSQVHILAKRILFLDSDRLLYEVIATQMSTFPKMNACRRSAVDGSDVLCHADHDADHCRSKHDNGCRG